jgi:hypothetical protein
MVLHIAKPKKETDANHAAQLAALERKLEPSRAQLRALPLRVGRYTRLACERHLRDLETSPERWLSFYEKVASAAVRF